MSNQIGNELGGSFEDQMLPHQTSLYMSARSLLRNPSEAEDAVQETYLQAWRCLDRFEPGTNCRAWLFGILFNVVRSHRRKWLQRIHLVEDLQTFENTLAASPQVPDVLDDEEILVAMAAIPRLYADAILMADVYEFDYKEIAEALAIPIGTVMSRISRGRALLRDRLLGAAAQMGIDRSRKAAA